MTIGPTPGVGYTSTGPTATVSTSPTARTWCRWRKPSSRNGARGHRKSSSTTPVPKSSAAAIVFPADDMAAAEGIMRKKILFDSKFTQRTLLAGATAGTLAIGSEPSSAQRCPAEPPARAKGPLVWLDMDQEDLDDAYDQGVYAFNSKTVEER